MTKAANKKPQYEQRLVLFLDILGFREIVDGTVGDPKALQAVIAAVDSISELREPDIHESKQVSQFSDSIVVSFAISEESAVFWLVNDVALTIVSLVGQGFLLRGGVTIGEMVHTEEYLLGPALVRAYEMESKEAINPRVIFDPEILNVARRYHGDQHSPEQEVQYVLDLLTEDADGKLYYDFVSWNGVVAQAGVDGDLYGTYLLQIGEMAAARLQHKALSVVRKGQWLLKHYIAAVNVIAETPSDSHFCLENEELCASIKSFPRYEDLAKAAEARLQNEA